MTQHPDPRKGARIAQLPNGIRGSTLITQSEANDFATSFRRLTDRVSGVVLGKRDQVELAFTCLLAGGHLLIEDVPGVAKSTLASTLAAAIGGEFRRLQFTPDLLPSDVTGGLVYNQKTGELEVHRGPVFTNVLLADEINRAAPRTQSALLEAMGEGQVSLDGRPEKLRRPFVCIATQNPIEMYGTYELPEAQLDRFTVCLSLGYPDTEHEAAAIDMRLRDEPNGAESGLTGPAEDSDRILRMMAVARTVHVAPSIRDYIARLAARTRPPEESEGLYGIELGVSPRGSIALARCAVVRAASLGECWVSAQHVKDLAVPVLAHRLVMTQSAGASRRKAEKAITSVLDDVETPDARDQTPDGMAA